MVAGLPALNITKRDCGRTIRRAKVGFPTSLGEFISHTHTQSGTKFKNKKLRTGAPDQEQIKDGSKRGREMDGGKIRRRGKRREERREGKNEHCVYKTC